jgi:hypothetical protein
LYGNDRFSGATLLFRPVPFATFLEHLKNGRLRGDWRRQASTKPCTSEPAYLLKHTMTDALEKRLIEALKSVDAHGDVAPAHVHDPMTMLLRENAIQAHLMRWDDARGHFVLTGTGRRRISAGSRAPGTVVSFRRRGVLGGGAPPRRPASATLKE